VKTFVHSIVGRLWDLKSLYIKRLAVVLIVRALFTFTDTSLAKSWKVQVVLFLKTEGKTNGSSKKVLFVPAKYTVKRSPDLMLIRIRIGEQNSVPPCGRHPKRRCRSFRRKWHGREEAIRDNMAERRDCDGIDSCRDKELQVLPLRERTTEGAT